MKITVFERYKSEAGNVVDATHEMWPIDAREAVRNDPERFSTQPFDGDGKGISPKHHKVEKRGDGSFAVELNGREIKDDLTKAEATKLAADLDAA